MPLELHIIRAHEFIQMGAHGRFDLAASKVALAQLARACRKRHIGQALIDLRALHPGPKPVFTPADLAELVNTFREVGFSHRERLAVLYQTDPHHRARRFAFLSKLQGWKVQAFDDFEQALLWLSSNPATETKRVKSSGEASVPLRVVKSLPTAVSISAPPAKRSPARPRAVRAA